MATVRYLVDDVDAAIAFYEDVLGFELEERTSAQFAMLSDGDLTLWLSGPGTMPRRALAGGREPAPGGWGRIVVEVRDLEAVVSRLLKAGATFRTALQSGPGGKYVLVDDPSGNPVELVEPG